jgi:putative transposase
MARLPRLYAAGYSQLISIQLREPSQHAFPAFGDHHYRSLVSWIGFSSARDAVNIHGWSITPRHIYILASPGHPKSIPALVQSLGRNLAAELKSGGVFSGRYHSMIPQPGRWVLPALIWLESQPVREQLTADPEGWPWSSARSHTGAPGVPPSWFNPHPDYWACGNTPFDRQAAYRQLLFKGNAPALDLQIEACLRGQWALGDTPFLSDLEKITLRRPQPGARGRPRKNP